eukprot:scaffold236074_cov10-Tisochrysis_lutea.AAC.1
MALLVMRVEEGKVFARADLLIVAAPAAAAVVAAVAAVAAAMVVAEGIAARRAAPQGDAAAAAVPDANQTLTARLAMGFQEEGARTPAPGLDGVEEI